MVRARHRTGRFGLEDSKTIGADLRRSVSLAAFPSPPQGDLVATTAKSHLPLSPLSAGSIYRPGVGQHATTMVMTVTKARPAPRRTVTEGPPRVQRSKGWIGSNANLAASVLAASSTLPSNEVTAAAAAAADDDNDDDDGPILASEARSSVPTPPLSRCSSGHASESTSATTLEDSTGSVPRPAVIDDDHHRSGTTVPWTPPDVKPSTDGGDGSGNVIVSVRVRPDGHGERTAAGDAGAHADWLVDGRRSLLAYRSREGGTYVYDHVFAQRDGNAKVYDACAKRLVRRVMEGYHGTVFAYGLTGTGKTYSMQGTASSPGVIPLAITDIFSFIRETPQREFLLRVSYLEIYNERIHDLLSDPVATGFGPSSSSSSSSSNPPEEIKLREDSKRGVYATPLKEEIVQSPTQLLRVIARGDLARRTGSTQYNSRSSRSHAVVQIVVESRHRNTGPGAGGGAGGALTPASSKRRALVPGGVRVSTLSLIDLAGSERAAETKERRQEGAHINKSLLTLGTVIARLSGEREKTAKAGGVASAVSSAADAKHLPYRDSKLTRLLQPALSGNSLISILCTVQLSPSAGGGPAGHTVETLNTLKFAARARNNIVSHAKRAEEALGSTTGDAASRALLDRYRMEIQDLRAQLDGQAKGKRDEEEEKDREKEVAQRHEEQMLEMQLARTALKERIEHLNRLILSSKSTGVNARGTTHVLTLTGPIESSSSSSLSSSSSPRRPRSGADGGSRPTPTSARSSSTPSTLGAAAAAGTAAALDALGRTASMGSTSALAMSAVTSTSPRLSGEPPGLDDDDSIGEYADGTASSAAQIRALQADLADKNRYVATLEKRLLQARRSSHSRTSRAFSPTYRLKAITSGAGEDGDLTALLEEKDHEIADLRARLDDKDHMVAALRSAARKREVADARAAHDHTATPHGAHASSSSSSSSHHPDVRRLKTLS